MHAQAIRWFAANAARRLGVLPDHAERVRADHVAPELSEPVEGGSNHGTARRSDRDRRITSSGRTTSACSMPASPTAPAFTVLAR